MPSAERIAHHLHLLCDRFPDRHVGGAGNRAATALFSRVAAENGFDVASAQLSCIEWEWGPSAILLGDDRVALHPGPYSLACDVTAPLAAASSVEELEGGSFEGCILLLHGPIAAEQLMAKNFVFYNPESHRRIVAGLEAQRPVAVLAATGRNPALAGGAYPFPLIEDGDFDIPNAYLTDVEGEGLLEHEGESVSLLIRSRRMPAFAQHVVARKHGRGKGRIVFFAHIDSKDGTPGALDNASGVAVLLVLAEFLGEYDGIPSIELVPLNGEDYYAATGQMRYLADNAGKFGDVILGLNVDGAGLTGERTAVSLYRCPEGLASIVRAEIAEHGFVEGAQWPQGDHSLLVAQGVPAVAVTSENAFFILSTIAHTPQDTPDRVDPEAIAEVSRFFADIVARLSEQAEATG